MASSDSFSTGQFAALAVVVVVGSCIAGYYIAGGLQKQPDKTTVTTSKAASTAPAASMSTPAATHQAAVADKPVGNYTAPNSPSIDITEEKAPKPPATDKPSTDAKPASVENDTEASQEDAPPPPQPDPGAAAAAIPSPVTGNATAPVVTAQNNPDPDYEQTTGSTDSEASQQGTPAVDNGASSRPRFRVQVGTFTQAMSARSLADALRNRGYTTTTVTDKDGDKTVYHVQTGAFKSRSTADRITTELQRQGFPAFVTTISD